MRVVQRYIVVFLLLGLASGSVLAQEAADTVGSLPGIEIETAVDRAESYIGDLITYTLTITYDSTYDLIPPPLGANLGAFDVKDYQPDIETDLDNGRLESRTIFVLSTYTTGEYVIPPLPVVFKLPDSTHKIVLAESIPITILSLLDQAGTDSIDIKPLKPQLRADDIYPPDYQAYIIWGGLGLLVLLVFGGLAFWWWLRHSRPDEADRPAWEIAFEKMAFLKVEYLEGPVTEQVRAKMYYLELTEILRVYLGRIYETDVLEMTTEQFLDTFREIELPDDMLDLLAEFFHHADRVKFARFMPESKRLEDDFILAHGVIERVRVAYESRLEAEVRTVEARDQQPPVAEEQKV